MREIKCDKSALLPHLCEWYIGNTFVNRDVNALRTPGVQDYIKRYHLDVGYPGTTDNDEEIPCIQKPTPVVPQRLISFARLKDAKPEDGIVFYNDDKLIYRFMKNPGKYYEMMRRVKCVIGPDLSTFQEFRLPIVRHNIYLNRLYTQELQKCGINVIPAMQWRDSKSYSFCFLGVPKGSAISISALGVKADATRLRDWKDGVAECIRQIDPSLILFYGDPVVFDFGTREIHWFPNENLRRVKQYGR